MRSSLHCRQKMQFAGNDFVVGKKLKKKDSCKSIDKQGTTKAIQ